VISGVAIVAPFGCDSATPAMHMQDAGGGSARPKPPPIPNDWEPLVPGEAYEGRSASEWAAGWMQWSTAATDCDLPIFDKDGSWCTLYQPDDEPVFYFQTGYATANRTECIVPRGKAILVPLVPYFDDQVGRGPDLTSERLEQEAHVLQSSVRDLWLRYDDREPDRALEDWVVGPIKSSYVLPPPPNMYACSAGELSELAGPIEPAYVGGAFVIFPPPPAGTHTIEYGGTLTNPFGVDERMFVSSTFRVE
jgi:hypothetical protein